MSLTIGGYNSTIENNHKTVFLLEFNNKSYSSEGSFNKTNIEKAIKRCEINVLRGILNKVGYRYGDIKSYLVAVDRQINEYNRKAKFKIFNVHCLNIHGISYLYIHLNIHYTQSNNKDINRFIMQTKLSK